mgnify:CR=1 FL=1
MQKTPPISKAILAINPSAEVSINADDINQITWHNGTPVISKEDILAKQTELQTAYNNKKYQRDRVKEYGSIASQIEFITEKGLEAWKTNVQSIKTKYPKESE